MSEPTNTNLRSKVPARARHPVFLRSLQGPRPLAFVSQAPKAPSGCESSFRSSVSLSRRAPFRSASLFAPRERSFRSGVVQASEIPKAIFRFPGYPHRRRSLRLKLLKCPSRAACERAVFLMPALWPCGAGRDIRRSRLWLPQAGQAGVSEERTSNSASLSHS